MLFYLNITLSIKEFSSWFRDICVVLTFYMNLGRDYNISKSFSWLKSYLWTDVLNKVVRTAVIYMYWMGSNSGNMRVINPSWLVINAQLLHAVEQAHIYKLRTDLSYSESLTIWVWLSASMVGVVSWKPIPQLTTYHLKTGSWTNTALVILQKERFSGTVSCL